MPLPRQHIQPRLGTAVGRKSQSGIRLRPALLRAGVDPRVGGVIEPLRLAERGGPAGDEQHPRVRGLEEQGDG